MTTQPTPTVAEFAQKVAMMNRNFPPDHTDWQDIVDEAFAATTTQATLVADAEAVLSKDFAERPVLLQDGTTPASVIVSVTDWQRILRVLRSAVSG